MPPCHPTRHHQGGQWPNEVAEYLGARVRHDVVAVTVMHLGESDITCGAARSILPGRASHEVRSSRNNVASSARMATHP